MASVFSLQISCSGYLQSYNFGRNVLIVSVNDWVSHKKDYPVEYVGLKVKDLQDKEFKKSKLS